MSYHDLTSVDPYYDDFDGTKNFHRILFKPGRAVQARELTQAQTILQDQVTKFADNIFKQNSPVTGGQVTTNFNCDYIKLQETYNNLPININSFNGLLVKDATNTVLARVIAVSAASGGDAPTLVVTYLSGNKFTDGSIIYDTASNLAATAISSGSTGTSSTASIAEGVFYVLGTFVQVQPSTIILSKYSSAANVRVGLTITESIVDYTDDASLLDPAIGASNYQAPGADRYTISLTLSTKNLTFGDDANFIELVRVINGQVVKMVDGSVYNVIDDYFAKRDYETNGDYVVNDFKLTPKTTSVVTDPLANTYTMSVGKGLAYVRGYRLENQAPIDIVSNRARTTASQNSNPVYTDFGSYFNVNTVNGQGGNFFDVTTAQTIDLHTITSSNITTANANTYSSTLVGTGYIRGLVYNTSTSDTSPNTYVYRAYVNDIQLAVPTGNVVSATSSTITFPNWFSSDNTAYIGVNFSITNGKDAGDSRTIVAYNGVTKVATVNQNFTVTPDTTSQFAINFDIKDTESIVNSTTSSYPATINAYASIDPSSKANGQSSGATTLQNPGVPELLFSVGNPYVATLTSTNYNSQQVWRSVSFSLSGGNYQAALTFSGDYSGVIRHNGTGVLSADAAKQNYTVVVTAKGSSNYNVGQILSFAGVATRSITVSTGTSTSDTSTLSITSADAGGSFTAMVIEKVYVVNADNTGHALKLKNLITANTTAINSSNTQVATYTFVDNTSLTSTGQVYIQNAGLVSPGRPQSLYLADVKNIVKIIDTGSSSTYPTVAMLTNPTYDVTNNYNFDNGQRDSYYDHATITLKPGAPQARGNLLVLVNYYQHAGGDGYFSVASYLNSSKPETYQNIPSYVSKYGRVYQLRDSLDFRPQRTNAQTAFTFRYANSNSYPSPGYGTLLPIDLTNFVGNYSYYLGRKDKLVLSKDRSFQIIQGNPSLNPLLPAEPDGSLVIANLTHNPYTGYIPTEAPNGYLPDLSVDKVKHKNYTMQDIAGLENRINQIEYYTALNSLEQNATGLQIPDAYGINRFKNGILVDDFSSFATADNLNTDYNATINRREHKMTASQTVQNFPLQSLALAYNMGKTDGATLSSLGYSIGQDGYVNYFGLPYTTANVASQKFASRTVNVNPFAFTQPQGVTELSPNVDNWVDTNYAPSLLIVDPNLQVYRSSNTVNVLQYGDWKTVSGTSYSSSVNVEGHNKNWSPYGYVGYTLTSTYASQAQENTLGAYDKIGNTYSLDNGYITDISILPYIRPQQIVVRSKGMLINTPVTTYFDNVSVDNYVRKTNIIELSSVSGTFNENDVIGYYNLGAFTATGRIVGVYRYNDGRVRLYVAADGTSTKYTLNGTNGDLLQNGFYNTSGTYQSNTAAGVVTSTSHYGSRVVSFDSTTNKITLAPLASGSSFTGNTLYICGGTGVGQSAVISNYIAANQTAILASSITAANGDIYSVGSFNTNEEGSFYGIFNLPANQFHTGQRTFRVDNSTGGNQTSATTSAEGVFYSEGLQVTSQGLDFGASPAGAKGTFTQSNQKNNVLINQQYSPWDPVAQTFIVSKDNYPNGIFLNSVKLFFRSKPTSSSAPVTLSIVGTQNGYPNGDTLDHSVVTLSPSQVNISETPQYLDSSASTTFTFNAPVYIQPGVLYSFIVKSTSNEYVLWTASNGDTAVSSSVKNSPTDSTPSIITKISSAPYVGGLFISQNSQTWTADQNQSLMFVLDRCVFNTSASPTIQYIVPKKLPYRQLLDDSLAYFNNANNSIISNSPYTASANSDVLVDAFNITTTDFTPTKTGVSYSYNATLASTGTAAGIKSVIPGKFGTTTSDDIYLNDGNGERVLLANSSQSFSLYAQLNSTDDAVSPVISDAGLSVYAVKWNINNCELSNSLITLVSGGTGYSNNTSGNTRVTITGGGGSGATAAANVSGGVIQSIYITSPGSGYITTPTITISDANTTPGSGASANIVGETSRTGGNALARYVTKKVVLDPGFDSGDLIVYLSAYRPLNTDINVYYKILNRNDTQKFDDSSWQLMTKINSSATLYSPTRNDIYEYTFAPGANNVSQGYTSYTSSSGQVYNSFSQFAIKVVLTTSDKTFVPFLNDLRAIALPPNVNTTV